MKFKEYLNEATKQQFIDLASLQRDAPEHAMLKVQFAMSGGVISPVVEHVGDLIHRMTEEPTFSSAGYEFVKPKVERCLRMLKNGYGFGREFLENITNNARILKQDPREFKKKIIDALEEYSKEHEQLPTYNRAQKLAQMAAVSLGRLKFSTTIQCLEMLNTHLINRDEWVRFAHQGLDK